MKHVIKENTLQKIIKKCVYEALRYDKEAKRYFPMYTGNPHSDAGKYASNNKGDIEFSHNDYQWSNPEAQKRFKNLQWKHNLEPDFSDTDRENEKNADDYLYNQEPINIIDKASKEMRFDFENLINQFLETAKKKYPVLNDEYHMNTFLNNLKDILDEY